MVIIEYSVKVYIETYVFVFVYTINIVLGDKDSRLP